MAPAVDAVECDRELPARTDVVVIGGGIIGVSTALSLAEKGVAVVLCEKGRIAGEQSSRNWGWCRKMGRDPAELPLAIESLRLWAGMRERVGGETGFRRTGILYLCETRKELEQYESWLDHARLYQLDSRLVDGATVDRLVPGGVRNWAGGLHTPSDGRAEPGKATSAMAAAVRRLGGTVLESCAVRGIETRAGHVAGVVTELGRIACQSVVLAGGAWSRLFCGNHGLDLPQLKILSSVARTAPFDGPTEMAVGAGNFAFRKRLDGGFTIAQRNANIAPLVPDSFRLFFDFLPALRTQWRELRLRVNGRFLEELRLPRRWSLDQPTPFERVRVLDPAPTTGLAEEGHANLARAYPAFGAAKVVERWAGLVDVTPDGVPVISPAETLPGFFLATGFSGHGFGIGPAAGRLTADLVTGDTPIVDPRPFRFARFAKRAAARPTSIASAEQAR